MDVWGNSSLHLEWSVYVPTTVIGKRTECWRKQMREGSVLSAGARENFTKEMTCSLSLKGSKERKRGSRQREQQIQGGTKRPCEFQTRGENFQHAETITRMRRSVTDETREES